MEDFIRAIGAEPVVYAMRNECCGGYITIEDRDYAAQAAPNASWTTPAPAARRCS